MRLPAPVDRLRERIDSMPLRQRALMLLAIIGLLFVLVDSMFLRPQAERRAALTQQLSEVDERVQTLTRSIESLAERAADDPNAQPRRRLAEARAAIESLRAELSALGGGIARAEDSLAALRNLLAARSGAALVELTKLPVENLLDDEQSPIFVHRFRLVFDADYATTVSYVSMIEGLPRGLQLESMRLEAAAWPSNRIEMIFYTLTLDEGWLDV
jgi:MSHA biogenesis protein MshJ